MTVHSATREQFKCELCEKCFSNRYALKRHMKIHSISHQQFTSEDFDPRSQSDQLKNHATSHLIGVKLFKCEFCEKYFSGRDRLENHLLEHSTGLNTFQCEVCEQCFSQSDQLTQHMAVVHGTSVKLLECENKSLGQTEPLRRRMEVHSTTSLKKYKCQKCDKRFQYTHRLKRHEEIHRRSSSKPGPKNRKKKSNTRRTEGESCHAVTPWPSQGPSNTSGWDYGAESDEVVILSVVPAGPGRGKHQVEEDVLSPKRKFSHDNGVAKVLSNKRMRQGSYAVVTVFSDDEPAEPADVRGSRLSPLSPVSPADVEPQTEVSGNSQAPISPAAGMQPAEVRGSRLSPQAPVSHAEGSPSDEVSGSGLSSQAPVSPAEGAPPDDIDIDDLLGGDSDAEEESSRDSSPSFAREDIVWELWYRGRRRPAAVRDEDLLLSGPGGGPSPVVAQLAMVTKTQRVKKKGLMLGLLTLTDGMEAFSLNQPSRLVSARGVRKFGRYTQDDMILRSQQSALHYLVLKSIFDEAKNYIYLHVNLRPTVEDGILSIGEFFSLEYKSRRSYISDVTCRTLPQPALDRHEALAAAAAEPMSCTSSTPPDVTSADASVEDDISTGNSAPAAAASVGRAEPDGSRLSPAIRDLVAHLPPTWPLDWVGESTEVARLQRIMEAAEPEADASKSTLSRRHELFFRAKERAIHGSLSELVSMSNPSFMYIFEAGGRMVELDGAVQSVLWKTVFEVQVVRRGTDRRLRKLIRTAPSPQVK